MPSSRCTERTRRLNLGASRVRLGLSPISTRHAERCFIATLPLGLLRLNPPSTWICSSARRARGEEDLEGALNRFYLEDKVIFQTLCTPKLLIRLHGVSASGETEASTISKPKESVRLRIQQQDLAHLHQHVAVERSYRRLQGPTSTRRVWWRRRHQPRLQGATRSSIPTLAPFNSPRHESAVPPEIT
ncbi:hypothetical protein BKA70DRAFT_626285 [Coprinopsis sp. MPI-PUGE-AT-0042]|nr:hypothetical protein BKA70DRAFT_626285 [Coprinopsis sp. MPI-PUGE-AT-0042]